MNFISEKLNDYMIKSDLGIVNIIGNSINNFYLYPYLNQPSVDAIFYYDFSNYSRYNGSIHFLNNKPIMVVIKAAMVDITTISHLTGYAFFSAGYAFSTMNL